MRSKVILLVLLLCPSSYALEFLASRAVGRGQTIRLSAPSASAIVSLPVAAIPSGAWRIETGYHRLFELSELDQVFVAAAGRWRRYTMAVGLSQFGEAGRYTEKLLKGSLGVHLSAFSVGLSLSGEIVEPGTTYGTLRAAGVGVSLAFRHERFRMAAAVDDLNTPSLHPRSVPVERSWTLYGEFLGQRSFSLTGRARWQQGQPPQYSAGQHLELSRRAAFFWGIQSGPLSYGAGLTIETRAVTFLYATSVHPVLGFTHVVSLTLGGGRRQDVFGP